MRYNILFWQEGKTFKGGQHIPCIEARVACYPNWWQRLWGLRAKVEICYGERTPQGWVNWYYKRSGKPVPATTYANYDDWNAGNRLGDILDAELKRLQGDEKYREIAERAKNMEYT